MPRGKRGRSKGGFGFAKQLTRMVDGLQEQRQKHAEALKSIDDIFARIGITTHLAGDSPMAAAAGKRRGRPAGKRGPGRPATASRMTRATSTNGRRRGRGKFSTTGTDSIVNYVKEGGAKGRTTSEINRHWKSQGRSGNAYITIGQLVKTRRLKRENLKGQRGSRYTAS